MEPIPAEDLERLRSALTRWAILWGVDGLENRLTLRLSGRLRSSLGRCTPAARDVRLAAFLMTGPATLLDEVVCHEAAHAAVYELHGGKVRPHGSEWKALMRTAGYEPKARVKLADLPDSVRVRERRLRFWEHRCPVCQAHRIAQRPMRQWRCAGCCAAGFDGELVIKRLEGVV